MDLTVESRPMAVETGHHRGLKHHLSHPYAACQACLVASDYQSSLPSEGVIQCLSLTVSRDMLTLPRSGYAWVEIRNRPSGVFRGKEAMGDGFAQDG